MPASASQRMMIGFLAKLPRDRPCFWLLDCKNSPQSISGQVFDEGHDKSGVLHILLVDMISIGWSMESGRRGFGASSGWRIF
ncbi:hypothetical protein TNCV_367791 [Trichonephila clavipes]|nr:hypothetical protein TNCV_367791 [Trichonephila clavipes]